VSRWGKLPGRIVTPLASAGDKVLPPLLKEKNMIGRNELHGTRQTLVIDGGLTV